MKERTQPARVAKSQRQIAQVTAENGRGATLPRPRWYQGHWLSFSTYFLVWLKTKGKSDYQDKIKSLEVYEIITSLSPDANGRDDLIEGELKDIRRTVFIAENGCISFAFICKEDGTNSISYVEYLEKYGDSTLSMIRILQAYAEYVTLISSGEWTLHIWADPPTATEPSFFFRNKPPSNKGKSAEELRTMYANLLKESGFNGGAYEWQPTIPPLPLFGKKGEESSQELYQELVEGINASVRKFNKIFEKTHVVKLTKPSCFSKVKFQTQRGKTNLADDYIHNLPSSMLEDQTLDFSTPAKAKLSSQAIFKRLSSTAGKNRNFYHNSWAKFNTVKNKGMIENYKSLILNFGSL